MGLEGIQVREHFPSFLRGLRVAKGFPSAASLAKAAGIARNHVAAIERAETLPRWRTARKLADALRLTRSERAEFYTRIEAARRPADAAALLGDGEAVLT